MRSHKPQMSSMLQADTLSLAAWLHAAEEVLHEAGCASSRYDAERLAAHGLGVTWGELWARMRDPIEPEQLDGLLDRRRSGEPLSYILGSAVFCGIELECGPGVLVPRPETETLVDVALELITGREAPVVVDIGTGTGAAAIAIARSRPDADVWATEASHHALPFAQSNVSRTEQHVKVVQGDLYDALPSSLRGRCDLVVSNPPYVPAGADVPPDVLAEPHVAVFAGPSGDEVLRRLARDAHEWVAPGGAVAFEIGSAEQIDAVAHELDGFGPPDVRSDHTGRPRVVWARR